jgi:hypothetical protein
VNVYDELCAFALDHRPCGETRAQVAPAAGRRYRVLLTCRCGAELSRSVTQEDADRDLAPAIRTRTSRAARRRRPPSPAPPVTAPLLRSASSSKSRNPIVSFN